MTQIIGDYGKRKRRFNPDLARIVNERTEREIRQRKLEEARRKKLGLDSEPEDEIKEEKKVIIPNKDFKLEELADSWIVSPVSYNDGLYAVEFGNSLLDNGDTKTQDNWVKYSLEAKSKDKLYVGDFPLYYSIFSTLFKNKDNSQFNDLVEKAKTQINHFMQQHWLMTLTRIKYVSNGKDKVIHNYGMPEQYEINENIVGEDEWVKDSNTPKIYQSLIGSDNIQEINSVFKWLNNVDAYLWRVNSKPSQDIERVARFSADSGRTGLYCDRNPRGTYSGLGVRICAEGTRKNPE